MGYFKMVSLRLVKAKQDEMPLRKTGSKYLKQGNHINTSRKDEGLIVPYMPLVIVLLCVHSLPLFLKLCLLQVIICSQRQISVDQRLQNGNLVKVLVIINITSHKLYIAASFILWFFSAYHYDQTENWFLLLQRSRPLHNSQQHSYEKGWMDNHQK